MQTRIESDNPADHCSGIINYLNMTVCDLFAFEVQDQERIAAAENLHRSECELYFMLSCSSSNEETVSEQDGQPVGHNDCYGIELVSLGS